MKKNKFFLTIAPSLLLIGQTVHAAGYKITTTIPGTAITQGGDAPTITAYVANLWIFGLLAGGVLAFIMIVYGAIEWTVSAGSQSKIEDAKDRIYQALIGLVLLFGAYLILSFINPNLVRLGEVEKFLQSSDNFPSVNQAQPSEIPDNVQQTVDPGVAQGCVGGCTSIDRTEVKALPVGQACKRQSPYPDCLLNSAVYLALNHLPLDPVIEALNVQWQIIQAWPPTKTSSDTCHSQGWCADIQLIPGVYPNVDDKCQALTAIYGYLENEGFKPALNSTECQNEKCFIHSYGGCQGLAGNTFEGVGQIHIRGKRPF